MRKEVYTVDTEVQALVKQTQEFKYQGSMDLQPGQKLWAFNMEKQYFEEIDLQDENNFTYTTRFVRTGAPEQRIKKIIQKKECVYVAAINERNAKRKVLAKFGYKFNKKGTAYNVDFPEEKLPARVIELNRPDGVIPHPYDVQNNPE